MAATVPGTVTLIPLPGIPEVHQGDHLPTLLNAALQRAHTTWQPHDVVVISSKVVSKSAGLRVPVASREEHIAERTVEVIAERLTPAGRTQLGRSLDGTVHVAAGVDASNTGEEQTVLTLPVDCDDAAGRLLHQLIDAGAPASLAVIITDTVGRPWRQGHGDVALGVAGMDPLEDLRGAVDADGRPLTVTVRAVADEMAAAADLVKGKSAAIPAAIVRGATWHPARATASPTHRPAHTDWFTLGTYEAQRAILGVLPGTVVAHRLGVPCITGRENRLDRLARALRGALYAAAQHPLTQDAAPSAAPRDAYLVDCTAQTATAAGALGMMVAAALHAEGFDALVEHGASAQECVVRLTER